MRIISRYIVREHVGPLVFALTALTSLLLLQYVARQLDKLVGKGLPWSVIGEFLLLSLPFTVAMTLPMAVLVATLHAFGRLASEHEVTAFKASGIRVRSLMAPVLVSAAILSVVMLFFNDQVLPRANHRLSILLTDIVSVRPTVGLRASVLTQVTETFYLRAGWLDESSNRMRAVEIYDLQNSAERKSVYADSGTFTLSPDSTDLQLVLYDGEQLQFPQGDARQLQRTAFREQVMRVKGMARGFSASDTDGKLKSEREQGICELQREYERRAAEYETRRQRWIAQLRAEFQGTDSVIRVPRPRPAHQGLAQLYCRTIPGLFQPRTAEAAEAPAPAAHDSTPRAAQNSTARATQDSTARAAQDSTARATQDSSTRAAQDSAQALAGQGRLNDSAALAAVARENALADSVRLAAEAQRAADSVAELARQRTVLGDNLPPSAMFTLTPEMLQEGLAQMSQYGVEVQKKFSLSLACLVFVLFGPPIALRFPRGGVGVTIGVSLVVFGAYYVCLMAGETLADKGRLDPVIAMWAANVIFTIAGVFLLLRVERTSDGSRGGGLRDWWADRRARRAFARTARAGAAQGAKA